MTTADSLLSIIVGHLFCAVLILALILAAIERKP